MTKAGLPYSIELNIPFENERQAEIACKTLSPDPILKVNELNVKYTTEASSLICAFHGVSDRVIRVAVSNVIDNIKTIVECMDEFDGKEDVLFETTDTFKINEIVLTGMVDAIRAVPISP